MKIQTWLTRVVMIVVLGLSSNAQETPIALDSGPEAGLGTQKSSLGTSLVVPNRFAEQEDDGYSGPLGTPMRLQNVYAADQFPADPIRITELRFRRDAGQPVVQQTVVDLRVTLSTTGKLVDALDASFEANLGPDATVVVEGPIALSSLSESLQTPGQPNPFDIRIPLANPFTYDPTKGNLLIEIRNRSGAGITWIDAANDPDDGASRAFSFDPQATTATFVDTGADIVQVVFAAIEPPALVVPNRFAEQEDDGYSGPLGTPMRLQNVYAASQFPPDPIRITELRFRRDAGQQPVPESMVDLKVTLSTTGKSVDGLEANFDSNFGADTIVVLDGAIPISSLSESSATFGAPNSFDIRVPLATPFSYDPSKGNLLIEIRNRSGAGITWIDAANDSDDGASRAFSFDAEATTATFVDTGADIVQLIAENQPQGFSLVPLPSIGGTHTGAWADFDADGDLDLYIAASGQPGILLKNEGAIGLQAVQAGDLSNSTATAVACVWADYDNDGKIDLLLVHRHAAPSLWRNQGDGTFLQNHSSGLVVGTGESYGAAWADYDGDGALDLFVINTWGANQLYRNNHDGTFTRILTGPIVTEPGAGVGCAWGDYDNDGRPDLFVANGNNENNRLYHNDGEGNFTRVTVGAIVNDRGESESAAWGDFDNDGWLDLFVANRLGPNFLYRNNGDSTFTRVTEGPVATDVGESNGCAWADFDNDGALDLFVSNWQGAPNFLYRNRGQGQFERVTTGSIASDVASCVGVAWGDYDGNGFPDLFVANLDGPSLLYRNSGNRNHWLGVKCIGLSSNRNGIGAKVFVRPTEGVHPGQVRQIASGTGWGSSGTEAHFGLGPLGGRSIVRVEWPSGQIQELIDVVADQVLSVVEPDLPLPRITRQPREASVRAGEPARFDAEVEGPAPLHFEWRRNGVAVGVDSPVLEIPTTTLADAGSYVVRVWNASGQVFSSTVLLTVLPAPESPVITRFPESQSIPVGGAATLSVEATGGSLTYEWFFNGSPIPDATSAKLELTRVTPEQAGTYGVLVKNSAGSASATAVLDVVGELPGGTIYFSNLFTAADIDAPVTDLDGVTRLTGDTYLAQLWAGLTAESLAPAGAAVPFHTDARSGYWQAGVRTLSGIAPGEVAFVQVKVWEAAKGPSFVASAAAGGRIGQSVVLQVVTGGDGTPPSLPANLVGLTPFKVVAELTPPIVSITSPMTGITQDNRVTLAGSISDNVGVASARWQWNDQPARDLHLMDDQFSVPGLELIRGRNLFRVTATDLSGNEAVAEVTVTWEPARTLIVQDAEPVQEGQRARTRLALASDGSVAGITFLLRYDPELLRDPKLDWSHAVRGAVAQVNLETPGVLRATLSMPGGRIAPGSQVLATIDFRSRSVPERTVSNVTPEVLDAADAQGNPLDAGTDTQAGTVVVLPRLIIGDNNGNDRLDIGDATVVQRFLAQLDEIRPWDVAANDLNASSALDSGDVIKVLRTVVRLDPQPTLPARSLTISANRHSNTGVTEAALSESSPDAAPAPSAGARLVVDKRVAAPGDAITVQVQLDGVSGAVAGARFTLNYPAHALRLVDSSSCRPGPMVPQDALVLWNVGTNSDTPDGTASGAFSSSTPWTLANGVLAEFTFQVQTGAANQSWPLELTGVEMTSDDGMEILTMMDQRTELNSAPALARTVEMTSEGARITLAVEPGASYTLETSDDLRTWRAYQTIIATGDEWQFTDPEGLTVNARFYRVRLNP